MITEKAENLVALIVRPTKLGCRQYPFFSIEKLEKFAARKPYRNEQLLIMPVYNAKTLLQKMELVEAECAVEFVRESIRLEIARHGHE